MMDDFRERAAALTAQLTEDEKLHLLTTHQFPAEHAALPEFFVGTEVARGFVGRDPEHYSTVTPQPVGLAATFDAPLLHALGQVIGNECRAYYNREHRGGLCVWGPTVDMERDPRWGRTEEAYGEDPYLTGTLSAALTAGMAGDDPVYMKTVPTLKHFCANNCEEQRMAGNSYLPPRLKYEYYYAAFMPAIRFGGARSVMTAYNEINGVPGLCNPELETVLREQWGMWFAVTDGGDFAQTVTAHKYCKTHSEALAEALHAGCELMTDDPELTAHAAREALRKGLLTWDEIDAAVSRVLYARLRLGMQSTDCPYDSIGTDEIDTPQSRALNLKAAQEQLVLLKNNGILPIRPAPHRIAAVGPLADENLMDWYTGHFRDAVSVLDGMREAFPRSEICTDSLWDLVTVQSASGRYLTAHADGTVTFDSNQLSEDSIFELQDWGENWQNLYSRKYRRYVRLADDGTLHLHNRRIYDWFTRETFRLHGTPDGTLIEEALHGRRLTVSADGAVSFTPLHTVTPEQCFAVTVISAGRDRAAALAERSDVVFCCTGNHPVQVAKECYDRKTLSLNIQPGMALHLHAHNPNTVLVLISGYPYAVCAEQEQLPAILWSTHAGAHLGTAVAGAAAGTVNPAGRLPMTWYRSEHELPAIGCYDIETAGTTYLYFRGKPLYPFGHGLSYSEFRYHSLTAQPDAAGGITAAVTLENISARDGEEVVQIYFTVPDSAVRRPEKKLCGFARVMLRAGERQTVRITVPQYILEIFDTHSARMLKEAGQYRLYAGGSSAVLPLQTEVTLPGAQIGPRPDRFEAQHFDGASGVTIGYVRELRRHDVRTEGWNGTLIYSGVPLAGKRALTLTASSVMQPVTLGVTLCGHSFEIAVSPADCDAAFGRYTVPLPAGLPDTGTLTVSMPGTARLLEIETEA